MVSNVIRLFLGVEILHKYFVQVIPGAKILHSIRQMKTIWQGFTTLL
jgi:hypothetical protein